MFVARVDVPGVQPNSMLNSGRQLSFRALRPRKSVHPSVPLDRNDRAFDRLDETKCKPDRQRYPERNLQPHHGGLVGLHEQCQRNDGVANQENDQVSGKVVSALVEKFFVAPRAAVGDFEEAAEHAASAAVRTFSPQSPHHSLCGSYRHSPDLYGR